MSESAFRRDSPVAERWPLPAVDGPILGVRRDLQGRDRAREDEVLRRNEAARQAEISRGYEAGVAAGRAELKAQSEALAARVCRLEEILSQLAAPLEQFDAETAQQLAMLALAVGRQLARRELKADPGQIVALIREAVGRLPAAAREVRVHLHPEDAAAVSERLATPTQERAWTVLEDPTLTRGGCLVRSDNSQIDARVESRINAIAGSMFAEERTVARAGADACADLGPDAVAR